MPYEKRLKVRQIRSALFLALGLALFIGAIWAQTTHPLGDSTRIYLTGTGGGLVGVALMQLLKTRKALTHPEVLRSQRIEEEDERNQSLAYRSGYTSMAATILLLYLLSFWYAFNDESTLTLIQMILCFMLVAHVGTWFWLRNR